MVKNKDYGSKDTNMITYRLLVFIVTTGELDCGNFILMNKMLPHPLNNTTHNIEFKYG